MYNDILFSGARRFMVTNVEPESGRLAQVGVVFYLEELKEVSEQTQDRVKYIGQHRVIHRAELVKVLNPSVAASRETYLTAEVRLLPEPSADEVGLDTVAQEDALRELFVDIVDSQGSLKEEPRFTEAVKGGLNFRPGTSIEDKGLWETIGLWEQFHEQRTAVIAQRMQNDVNVCFQSYLQENPLSEDIVNSRGEVRLADLPEDLLVEIQGIQSRFREELDALDSDPRGTRTQLLLQCESHGDRLALFRESLEREQKRLAARSTLKSLFEQ